MSLSQPACLLCGGPAGSIVFPYGTVWDGRRFDYVRCQSCGSSFIDPLPDGDDLARMYSHSEYHSEYYQEASEEGALTQLHAVLPLLKPGGRLLDFGCGSGSFLIAARKAGFRAEGVELEEQARRRAAAASGCPVRSMEELREGGGDYDVIHLGDVLEHLPEPDRAMRDLERLLAPDGVFFVEGPIEDNASAVFHAARLFGLIKRLARRKLHADLPPFHLIRTTARAQRRYFERRLGYVLLAFRVHESGWPYWNDGDRFLRPGSASRLARMLIGALAVGLARIAAPLHLPIGNRFFAVARPSRPS
ncbi:MAG: hypothetical protein QOH81_807 [Sphingomonadales bacterium]|jgi:SAM-dependent methyltransferase|nr:hypothetical protein [Sphingomonadales bacterium]